MTKKIQTKVVKKSESKKVDSPKKSESTKKPKRPTSAAKPSAKKSSLPPMMEVGDGGLGKKHSCYNCNTKFYDLGKEAKLCPKCGSDQNARPSIKVKVPRSSPKLSEFDVVDEDVVAELSGDEDTILETDSDGDDPEPIIDEDEN